MSLYSTNNRIFYLISMICFFIATTHCFILKTNIKTLQGFSTKITNINLRAKEETPEQIKERIRTKVRKNLYNEKGIAFAPWVTRQIDEDAIVEDLYRKETSKADVKKPASTLDRGEIESSEGMRWRMNGDQVELAWVTNNESGNQGFLIEKRSSYTGDFQEVASFREVSQLVSKGVNGGRYKYTDPSTNSGSWIYRVKDCDASGAQNVICQCFVEVQSASESKTQSVVLVAFLTILIGAFAVGYTLDPQQ